MKRYKNMMDQVEAPEELHQRLTGLTAPKKAAPWKRYGAVAAAFVLAVIAGYAEMTDACVATGAIALGLTTYGIL